MRWERTARSSLSGPEADVMRSRHPRVTRTWSMGRCMSLCSRMWPSARAASSEVVLLGPDPPLREDVESSSANERGTNPERTVERTSSKDPWSWVACAMVVRSAKVSPSTPESSSWDDGEGVGPDPGPDGLGVCDGRRRTALSSGRSARWTRSWPYDNR